MAVTGVAQMRKKLGAMPAKVRAAGRAAMEKGAQEIVDMMKRLAPVDSGDLRDSIGWTWSEAPAGSVIVAQSLPTPNGNQRIVVYAGSDKAFYARMLEFGTQKMPASPYFFPAYRALKSAQKTALREQLGKR